MNFKLLKNSVGKIREIGGKINKFLAIVSAFGLFFFAVFGSPILIASNLKATAILGIIIATFVYILIWVVNFLIMIDSASYIYGFSRPILSRDFFTSRIRLIFIKTSIETPFTLIKYSLISYALTLYGFVVAYIFISQLDEQAFNIKKLDFISSFYFTIVTAATVGYGDILPVSPLARLMVTLEIIFSFLYVIFIFSSIAGFAQISKGTNISQPEKENEK